jgi:hypothetical protein
MLCKVCVNTLKVSQSWYHQGKVSILKSYVLQHGCDRPYRSFLNIRLWTRCDLYELEGKMAAFASEDTKEW